MNSLDLQGIALLGLIGAGLILMATAAIGIVRMPDLYLRASVSSKAATLGSGFLMLACALYFEDLGVTSRALAVVLFMMLTAPVAGHMIGRAAYRSGAPFWSRTQIDSTLTSQNWPSQSWTSEERGEEER